MQIQLVRPLHQGLGRFQILHGYVASAENSKLCEFSTGAVRKDHFRKKESNFGFAFVRNFWPYIFQNCLLQRNHVEKSRGKKYSEAVQSSLQVLVKSAPKPRCKIRCRMKIVRSWRKIWLHFLSRARNKSAAVVRAVGKRASYRVALRKKQSPAQQQNSSGKFFKRVTAFIPSSSLYCSAFAVAATHAWK